MKANIVKRAYSLVVALVLTMLLAAPTVLAEVVHAELSEQSSIAATPNGECQYIHCGG